MGRISNGIIFLLVFFLVAFPKGGFKINDIPITWGYLCITLIAIVSFLKLFRMKTLPKINLYILLFMLPFQIIICLGVVEYGYSNSGLFLSTILNFMIFPFVFLVLFNIYEKINLFFLLKILKWSIFFTAVYGIILFVYIFNTGEYFEIPYLSVNMDDDNILYTKSINRGDGFFKLISTYNNGNLYGVSVLMLLPLYCFLEKNNVRIWLVKLALIFTLSRTVWIGLLLFELINIFNQKKFRVKELIYFIISLGCLLCGILWFIESRGFDISFLFDRNLGGRSEYLKRLDDIQLFPNKKLTGIGEIVYLSILDTYGLFGLVAFIVGLFSPILFYFFKIVPYSKSQYKKSIATGIFIYLFVAFADGGILLIPVMCFYWFCVFLLVKNYTYVE